MRRVYFYVSKHTLPFILGEKKKSLSLNAEIFLHVIKHLLRKDGIP